jgi:P4 family phage/plasmid primase-like protien
MNIFVLEKKNVNKLNDKTKDGIHIVFGLQVHKAVQVMIRNDIVSDIAGIWDDLPITNTWDQVVDEGVAKGHVNWQLYGSRKPGHEAYLISTHYTTIYNNSEWGNPIQEDGIFDTSRFISQLSARFTGHPESKIKDEHKERFDQEVSGLDKRGRKKTSGGGSKDSATAQVILNTGRFDRIKNEEMLDEVITCLTEQTSAVDYRLRETHEFTLALPSDYYGPGSYNKWIRVGWALANTSPKMFVTWLKLSTQDGCRNTLRGLNGKFDWKNSVQEMYDLWKQFDCHNPDGLSHRSIMYWCKRDNFEKYEDIRKSTIDYFIDQTVIDKTEFDLASVLFNIFKDRFVCVSIKNNCWYEYKNHRWFEIDSGTTLRLCISKEMHHEYLTRIHNLTTLMQTMEQSDGQYEAMRKKTSTLASIAVDLKKTVWKNNIMREARELFYDKDFFTKLDENPYLLCFSNGVVDFKQKLFRAGQPDDYISKCTNIEYLKMNSYHDSIQMNINKFLDELFPDKELRRYMFDHLASVLIGTLDNQTFNIYTGSGRNGKSCLVDLMSKVLGDYKGTVPSTLITQKRASIGSTSSEIVQLMGTRYAVMQEPSKGDKINEGIMKEITGGDPIQGRALFKDTITFIPQFKLVVTTNVLFDIKSNDDGTWRRIRVCDFESKFLEKPYEDEFHFPKDQFPYQFPLDKKLDENFETWAPVFAAMLVKRAFETQGNVRDCPVVLSSSNEYREGQDYLAEFAREKIAKSDGDKIKKQEIMHTFREWYQTNYGRNVPKSRELYEYMDRRFGRYKNGWHNVKLNYDDDEDEYN